MFWIQLSRVSTMNFFVCKELSHSSYSYIYSCYRNYRTFLWCILLLFSKPVPRCPMKYYNTATTTSEWKILIGSLIETAGLWSMGSSTAAVIDYLLQLDSSKQSSLGTAILHWTCQSYQLGMLYNSTSFALQSHEVFCSRWSFVMATSLETGVV